MSKADKMFEKLGYKKKENETEIEYSYVDKRDRYKDMNIVFYKLYQKIEPYYPECREDYESDSGVLNMQELQAINEKVKELKWI